MAEISIAEFYLPLGSSACPMSQSSAFIAIQTVKQFVDLMRERESSTTNTNSNMVGMNDPQSKQNVREGESDSHPREYRMKKTSKLTFLLLERAC